MYYTIFHTQRIGLVYFPLLDALCPLPFDCIWRLTHVSASVPLLALLLCCRSAARPRRRSRRRRRPSVSKSRRGRSGRRRRGRHRRRRSGSVPGARCSSRASRSWRTTACTGGWGRSYTGGFHGTSTRAAESSCTATRRRRRGRSTMSSRRTRTAATGTSARRGARCQRGRRHG